MHTLVFGDVFVRQQTLLDIRRGSSTGSRSPILGARDLVAEIAVVFPNYARAAVAALVALLAIVFTGLSVRTRALCAIIGSGRYAHCLGWLGRELRSLAAASSNERHKSQQRPDRKPAPHFAGIHHYTTVSVDERSGQNPVTGQPIVPSSSTDRHATINGHEVNVGAASRRDHLQYACIFDLPTAMQRDCSEDIYNSMDPTIRKGCDCRPDPGGDPLGDIHARNRPICVDTWQVAAKACPGTRHLEILRGLGPRGVVASVCPKFSADADMTEPSYGYDAVVDATLTRLRGLIE